MITSREAASLTDSELDSAYEVAYKKATTKPYDSADMNLIADEIGNRLQSIWSFTSGIFGSSRFPKYEKLVKFSQSEAARSSTVDAAKNAPAIIGGAIGQITRPLVIVGVVGIVLVYLLKKK